jgi:hypothetical protein
MKKDNAYSFQLKIEFRDKFLVSISNLITWLIQFYLENDIDEVY